MRHVEPRKFRAIGHLQSANQNQATRESQRRFEPSIAQSKSQTECFRLNSAREPHATKCLSFWGINLLTHLHKFVILIAELCWIGLEAIGFVVDAKVSAASLTRVY